MRLRPPRLSDAGAAWAGYKRLTQLSWPRRFPIVQFPNAPLIIAFLAGQVASRAHGHVHADASAISYLALAIWAYEELFHGVNWFRHLLGLAYTISTAVHLAAALAMPMPASHPTRTSRLGKESAPLSVSASAMRTRPKHFVALVACSAAAPALAACGATSHHTGHRATRPKRASAIVTSVPAATSTAAAAPPPPPHLRIVAPGPGATVTQTLTVRLVLTSAPAPGSQAFRYVLDGTLVRLGSTRLTFHGLASGRHDLTVMLAARRSVKATRTFIVPAPAAAPAATAPVTMTAPPPATPAVTAASPAPAPPPTSTNRIPQGPTAGDADGDNQGAASDGDGNI